MAIASLVLGIASIAIILIDFFARGTGLWIPFTYLFVVAIPGVIFGILRRKQGWLPITGLVLSAIGLLFVLVFWVLFVTGAQI
jgi:hypothetical protein